jgi:hypothetical protein
VQLRCLLVVAAVALVAAGCASSKAASTSARMKQAHELQALERPTVREIKLTFIALVRRRDGQAAESLERTAEDAHNVLEWVDDHRSFASANEPTVECLEESLGELRERAEEMAPALRDRSLEAGERIELRRALAEAANCIQAGD